MLRTSFSISLFGSLSVLLVGSLFEFKVFCSLKKGALIIEYILSHVREARYVVSKYLGDGQRKSTDQGMHGLQSESKLSLVNLVRP